MIYLKAPGLDHVHHQHNQHHNRLARIRAFIQHPVQSNMRKHLSKFFIAIFASLLSSAAVAEDPALAKLFEQHGIDGTLVISSLHSGKTFMHNDTRATRRYSTASTFKILNTLISLEEKAITGKDDVLKWDGNCCYD